MKTLIGVGVGSFIGGVARYAISAYIQTKNVSSFPLHTFLLNILGCFIIGLCFGIFEKYSFVTHLQLFIVTGILGGFTTFSAFSYETFVLFNQQKYSIAALYMAASVFVGVLLTFVGYFITKIF